MKTEFAKIISKHLNAMCNC